MPAVAAVGWIGCWPRTGRAAANCCGLTGCATAAIGRDPVIAAAGTDVAPLRLTKLFTLVLVLLMFVTLVTCVTLTCCR
jgi:hypothetical protein